MLHPADLAVGAVIVGYGMWRRCHRRPKTIEIDMPYLLNVPAEIRLLIYEFVFNEPDQQSASSFLRPLLTCQQIYHEAYRYAFLRSRFVLPVDSPAGPFLSPHILRLPSSKLSYLRYLEITWSCTFCNIHEISRLFVELSRGPLRLDQFTFSIRLPACKNPFCSKLAPVYRETREFGRYVMEELPLMDNVQKIVIPSPGISIKKSYQMLFAPNKPCLKLGGSADAPTIRLSAKKLGNWRYTVIRDGTDVRRWKLELTHYQETKKKRAT
ncbi:hypothetical protein CC78DRAFT_537176 [Lojkania enalia]|uniref:Uncharacterized protein n=1 Tax=Lojkania enalia TaxID=147567 RepID=A0A9P4JY56_9PLEO|nr:hypothetical protein CC78DRAFT_537176 [Didymosphaeria enalia]